MSTPDHESRAAGLDFAITAHLLTELWKSDGAEAVLEKLYTMSPDTARGLLMVMIGARAST